MGTHVAPAVVLWLVVVGRVSMLRRPGSSRALWAALAFLAAAETLQVRAVYQKLNDVFSSPVAGSTVKIALATGAAAAVLTLVAMLTGWPTRAVRRNWALAGLVTTVVALPAVLAPPAHVSASVAASTEFYDNTWRSLVHWLPFLAYLTWALGAGVVLCVRYSRRAPASPLRTGLRLIGAGCGIGFAYVALKLGVLWAWHFDPPAAATWTRLADDTLGSAVLAVCIIVIAAGCAWEALAARATGARSWLWAARSLRQLRPLWKALVALYPDVALVEGRPGGSERRIRFRLLRSVVEIRDGLLEVAKNSDPASAAQARLQISAAGVAPAEADAALVAALVARARSGGPQLPCQVNLPSGDGSDLRGEVKWLKLVAKQYRTSASAQQNGTAPKPPTASTTSATTST